MAIFRALVVLGVCVAYSLAQQNCDQAQRDFGECLKSSFKSNGQKPNVDDFKTKADKCFSDAGCVAPTFPQPGQAPQGGRAGRVGGSSGANDQHRQCFQAVGNRTKDAMVQCMRKTDPSFTFPTGGQGHGGEHGHGGPGGEHGPGGPGGHGPGGPGGHGGEEVLKQACNNDAAKTEKVKTCFKNLFGQGGPGGKGNGRDAWCNAKKACEAKLGSCKETLEKRREAMCNCGKELASKRDEIMKSEPACANLAGKGPAGGQHKEHEHDCSAKHDSCP